MNLPMGFSIAADFYGAGLTFLGLFLAMVLFTILANRKSPNSKGQLSKSQLGLILLLRTAAIIILLLLVFEPDVSLNRERTTAKNIAVVLDQSSSMKQAWMGDSLALQESVQEIISELEAIHKVDLWSMGGEPIQSDTWWFNEQVSVFSWSPKLNSLDGTSHPYTAMLLISDGHLNGGRSPLDMPWSQELSIFPVLPLDAKSSSLLKILDCDYKVGTEISGDVYVNVSVQQDGLIGRRAKLVLQNDIGQVLGEESFTIDRVFSNHSIPVLVTSGSTTRVKVTLIEESESLKSEHYLNVSLQGGRSTVLIASERINELHKFLQRSFPDSLYDLQTVTGTENRDVNLAPEREFKNIDLIILNQPGMTIYSEDMADLIRMNRENNLPLIVFHDGTEPLSAQWADLLNIQQLENTTGNGELSAFWNHLAQDHPFFLGLQGQGVSDADLVKFPPLASGNFQLKSQGSELIMTGADDSYNPVLTLKDVPPTAIFSSGGLWKWFFHPQANLSFNTLWEYLLLYLDDVANFKPVELQIPIDSDVTGAFIQAKISVKDLDNRIIPAAELRAWQEFDGGIKEALDLTRNTDGTHSATILTGRAGKSIVVAEALRFGELWGHDTSRINLMSFNSENQSKGVDEAFLFRLAKQSGGEVIQYGQEKLPDIPIQYFAENTSYKLTGVRSSVLFVMLVTLFVAEWVIRRRNGLL